MLAASVLSHVRFLLVCLLLIGDASDVKVSPPVLSLSYSVLLLFFVVVFCRWCDCCDSVTTNIPFLVGGVLAVSVLPMLLLFV